MSNIQDIHAFAERIYDIVQEYVDGNYNADDVLAIGKVNFHPDDDFADYISLDDQTPTFSDEKAVVYNRLMDESFAVCEAAGVDIYELGLQELETVLKPIEA